MGRVREVFAAMGREMRKNKGSFAVYVVLRLIVLACAVGSLAFDNYEAFFLCLLTLVLFLVPPFIEVNFSISIPETLEVVIALFLLFLYAGTRIAQSSPDNFGTMVAGGCTIMIAFQAFLNIAMVIGWFPVVGKPLPFISSGGSSLVAMLIMVGIILSVSRGAEAPTIYDRRRADLRVVRATNGAPPPSRGGRSSSSRGRR